MIKHAESFAEFMGSYGKYVMLAGGSLFFLFGLYIVVAAFVAMMTGTSIIHLPTMFAWGAVSAAMIGIPAIFMKDGEL